MSRLKLYSPEEVVLPFFDVAQCRRKAYRVTGPELESHLVGRLESGRTALGADQLYGDRIGGVGDHSDPEESHAGC